MDVCPADGGYFLVADAKRPATDFARSLADETGVVCTPLSVFYATPPAEDSYVRFTICKSAAHVDRACAALGAYSAHSETSNKTSTNHPLKVPPRSFRAHVVPRWLTLWDLRRFDDPS